MRLGSLLLLPSLVGTTFAAIGPVAVLPIVNRELAPDGVSRSTVLAGGTFPGPMISGKKGDHFKITVVDELRDKTMDVVTSIHWHGIDQISTNPMDGVAFVTQCPIVPGNSFEYNFRVPNQAGTFWYHSHFSTQYCDGLRGAFVVYDPEDPHAWMYDVDDESTVITLADWYHYPASQAPPIAPFNSTLINGHGRDLYNDHTNTALAVVNVVRGKRYRFRVISMSCDPNYLFSIDGHQLTVIEADGNNVQPLVVDEIQIFAAQRYSVVLHANQPVNNYWIRAIPGIAGASNAGGRNAAILRYLGAAVSEAKTKKTGGKLPLVESNLHPLEKATVPGKPYPGGADVNINLDVTLDPVALRFLVNNATYDSPEVPVLLQLLNGTQRAQDLLPKGSVYPVARNKSVELTFPGGALGGPHPIHIHGQSFYVVRSAGNSSYNFENPVLRDVVSIGNETDLVTIRFMAENPGPWLVHCHIDWHLRLGFAAVLATEDPSLSTDVATPESWKQLCPTYNRFAQKKTL
uniref:laccase n=1 Tax=Amylostereum areolatum TaxID=103385 RepID=A0A873P8S2_9AGAM|nr:laccase 2 [Amylostereum areolatum]